MILWARSIELYATIVYVEWDAKRSGEEPTMNRLIEGGWPADAVQ